MMIFANLEPDPGFTTLILIDFLNPLIKSKGVATEMPESHASIRAWPIIIKEYTLPKRSDTNQSILYHPGGVLVSICYWTTRSSRVA